MNRMIGLLMVAALASFGPAAFLAVNGIESENQGTLEVKNWKGTHVGTAKYVVTDSSTGNVTFVIVYLDQEPKKEIAVPVTSFSSYDRAGGILILNVSREELASAP